MEEYQELIGMPIEKAAMLGYNIRVVEHNGVPLAGTADYKPGRINVAVKDSLITEIISRG